MPRDDYALSVDELERKLDSARSAASKRYRGIFEPIVQLARRTFARRPVSHSIEEIDGDRVKEVACTLEAALVMAEKISPDEQLALVMVNRDLAHFVGYMRALDHFARALAERNEQLTKRIEELDERRKYGKNKVFEKDAAAGAPREQNRWPTSVSDRHGAGVRDRRERPALSPWDIPLAQKTKEPVSESDRQTTL